MLRVKAAISTMGAMVIGFFILAIFNLRFAYTPMSTWSDDAPPHSALEMPIAYDSDASVLSSLAW
jgi:hypothetical protein